MAVLAIDQGTTTTRALQLDSTGRQEIVRVVEHRQYYPKPGWVEHDPEELIQNIRLCIDAGHDIWALGIDNQGESCLAWDAETKKAITPVIVWQDDRTREIVDLLKSQGKERLTLERAGLPLDPYFSAAKLGWIMENISEARSLHDKGQLRLGTTDAFFLDRLTGNCVTDISTASRTSLMNLETGQWDESLCDLFKVPRDALPGICATCDDFGSIETKGGAIPITANIVDQQAALFGHGARTIGDAKITFGTGAFALVVTGGTPFQASDKGLLPTVAWQLKGNAPTYALDGGVFSAGSAVNWARSLGLFTHFDQINSFSSESAISRDLVFVPALAGLGCPHWDRSAAGTWIGLSLDTTPMDMVQSILEGIVFRTAEVIREMNRIIPISDQISIDGGLTANPYFCQFLADVLQRKLIVPAMPELTALGTAFLAADPQKPCPVEITPPVHYYPETDISPFRERFTQALKRSSRWRSKKDSLK